MPAVSRGLIASLLQVGCWQPQFSSYNPYGEVQFHILIPERQNPYKRGIVIVDIAFKFFFTVHQVHMFRMSLWAEHLKTWEESFRFPGTLECTQVWLIHVKKLHASLLLPEGEGDVQLQLAELQL